MNTQDQRLIDRGFPCHQVGAEMQRERGARGCLERPCAPFEPLSLGTGHPIGGLPSEPAQHQPTHRQVDHGLTALGEVLIIFTQAAVPTNPGARAFYHPPARQHREAGTGGGSTPMGYHPQRRGRSTISRVQPQSSVIHARSRGPR